MNTLRILALSLVLAGCSSVGDTRPPGDAEFTRVGNGMTRDDTRRALGAPVYAMRFPLSGNESWEYEYRDAWGYTALFCVIFGPQGGVISTFVQRVNDGGDYGQ